MKLKEKIKNLPVLGALLRGTSAKLRMLRKRIKHHGIYVKNKEILARNAALKDRHAGKRIFILSAGPSMKTQNLEGLENEICISIGNVFVHPAYSRIKPAYHVFAQSHSPITNEQWAAWMSDADKHFQPGQTVMMGIRDKDIIDKIGVFKRQGCYYYFTDELSFKRFEKEIDFTKPLPTIQTQVHWAIYLAMYMGAKEIYLLGCDHNWYLGGMDKDSSTGRTHSKHFYDYKDYVLAQKGYNDASLKADMEVQFQAYVRLWKVYKHIRDYADRRGIKVVNVTPGSLLDVFPRAELADVLRISP